MKEPESLDHLLRDWTPPAPGAELDRRVASAYRSAVHGSAWRQFLRIRISVPAPVLLAATVAIFVLFFWLRPAAAPAPLPQSFGSAAHLKASGFQPLPNGEARILPVSEVQR